jgi:hypothetical protein
MNEEIKAQIIIKMVRRAYWGHRMINFSDLIKSVPTHLRKEAKVCINELFKEEFLNRKPGIKSEFRYSLRRGRKVEIDDLLKKRVMYKNDTFKV